MPPEALTQTPGAASGADVRPELRPEVTAVRPPETARTAEQFDTTTAEQRAAAVRDSQGTPSVLGTTVVSLGNPAEPGFWVATPLVEGVTSGRVRNVASDVSVAVELRPIEAAQTAGSRISLAAMRVLGLPLGGLSEVEISATP